ncbi:MAG: NAD(P)H-dependent oxidoreductase [Deltaproteobacteria bacterium]|nr:NAD(P)H-dependent oxidoreductase [Deltaproteobacteria bacterium]
MFVLGLQGSPRTKGNSAMLLTAFLTEAEQLGALTQLVNVAKKKITPCQECGTCEKEGCCPINDDMQQLYPLLRQADIIAMATPIFFYGPTAQMKAVIDRSQALWSRKYVLGLSDPGRKWRRGCLLEVGATKGKNLFDGTNLTAKYFYDAVGAGFEGSLEYRRIENPGDIKTHPTALKDAKEKARSLIAPSLNRKKILFLCKENACRSQMASAFAQLYAGDRVESLSAGTTPAKDVHPLMLTVMSEKGVDMGFRRPLSVAEIPIKGKPDLVISMGCEDAASLFPGVPVEAWDLEDPAHKSISFMHEIRDAIERKKSPRPSFPRKRESRTG